MSANKILVTAGFLALILLAGCRSAHVTSAIIYIDQQMFDKAIEVLHEGLDYSPDEAEAYFYLGEAHSKKAEEEIRDNDYLEASRNYTMAYDYYEKTLEVEPTLYDKVQESLLYSYVMQSNNAKNEYQAGFYEAAEGYFRLAYTALPDSVAPIKNLARMKIQLAMENDNDPAILNEALELLDQVLEVNPGAYELLSDKANVLTRLERRDEAAAIYDDLLANHPDDAPLMIDIANLSQEQGDSERAGDLLVRVLTIYENDDDTNNDESVYFLSLQAAAFYGDSRVGRYTDAISLYEKALSLEDFAAQSTLENKLILHYRFGQQWVEKYNAEEDPVAKAEYEQQAVAQFETGVNVGNALIGQYLESVNGFYYLAECYRLLDDEANFNVNMEQWRKLSGME
jgi:tetratricopeptide (TPR) repeat protein